jgi:hypothetical protein
METFYSWYLARRAMHHIWLDGKSLKIISAKWSRNSQAGWMYTPAKANEEEKCKDGVESKTEKMQMRCSVCVSASEQRCGIINSDCRSLLQSQRHARTCLGNQP